MKIEMFDSFREAVEDVEPVDFDRIAVSRANEFADQAHDDQPEQAGALWDIPVIVDSSVHPGTVELRLGDKLAHLLVYQDDSANQSDRPA